MKAYYRQVIINENVQADIDQHFSILKVFPGEKGKSTHTQKHIKQKINKKIKPCAQIFHDTKKKKKRKKNRICHCENTIYKRKKGERKEVYEHMYIR